mgnify:CR=1 FL=1
MIHPNHPDIFFDGFENQNFEEDINFDYYANYADDNYNPFPEYEYGFNDTSITES